MGFSDTFSKFISKAHRVVGTLDEGLDLAKTFTEPAAVGVKSDLVATIIAGSEKLLEQHDVQGLTEEENQLLDEATSKLLELGIRVAARVSKDKLKGK